MMLYWNISRPIYLQMGSFLFTNCLWMLSHECSVQFSHSALSDSLQPHGQQHSRLPSVSSVQFSGSVVSDSLWPHESQHDRPPVPSPTPKVYSNSCPLSQWCHPAISSSVVPFSSCPQPIPASGSFPTSQLFTWGGQTTGVSASASVLPINTQD